jgi:hypothetical protein
MSEWYGDDPQRALPQRPFYADWDEKEREVVADRKEDVALLISDARAWEKDHGYVWLICPHARSVNASCSRMEYTQYVKHLRKDVGIDVSHFNKNVGVMVDGYLNAVADANSWLRGILKLGASGFG